MTEPTDIVWAGTTIDDFVLGNAKYEEDIWTDAIALLTERLIEEAKKQGRQAYDFVEDDRYRLKLATFERGDGTTGEYLTRCKADDPEAIAWELRMKASTRPLDTVASSD